MSHKHPEFPLDDSIVYLNHAAVAPWPARTATAVSRFAEENARIGAQHYPQWLEVEQRLRERAARLINAPSPDDIAFLKNTSEALSTVAYGLSWRPGDNVVTSRQEFPSNRVVWESLSRFGVETRLADLTQGPSPEDVLLDLIDERTRLLSISAVQYANGLRMDLRRLGAACRERGVLFCVDAIQGLGALQFDAQAIEADFVAADGHKWLLAAEGLAVFYCRAEVRDQLQLNQYGWRMLEHAGDFDRVDWTPAHSARRFECGSPNMLGIYALEASLSLFEEIGLEQVERNVIKNISYLYEKIGNMPDYEVLSSTDVKRRSGIVTFRPRQGDPLDLHRYLMMDKGVVCAPRGGGVRLSPHFYTPTEDLDRVLAWLDEYCSSN